MLLKLFGWRLSTKLGRVRRLSGGLVVTTAELMAYSYHSGNGVRRNMTTAGYNQVSSEYPSRSHSRWESPNQGFKQREHCWVKSVDPVVSLARCAVHSFKPLSLLPVLSQSHPFGLTNPAWTFLTTLPLNFSRIFSWRGPLGDCARGRAETCRPKTYTAADWTSCGTNRQFPQRT
jgi:hypothetical protein